MFFRLIRLCIFTGLYIATCALVMSAQTFLLIDRPPDPNLFAFIFYSTICSYNFHWFLTPDSSERSTLTMWSRQYRNIHLILLITGLAGSIFFIFRLLEHWPWLVSIAVITFLYSAPKIPHSWFKLLKKVAYGKTLFLAGVWTYVTTVLPIVVAGENWEISYTLFAISRFFLVYAICILFDYRDRERDKADGIRSMITYFGEKGVRVLFIVSLIFFFIFTGLLIYGGLTTLAVVMIALPGIILAFLSFHAWKNTSAIFYYIILDGLMMLSGLLMLGILYF